MAKLVIGVDVGGTKVEAILHDGKKVLKTARGPSEAKKSYKTALAAIIKVIDEVRTNEVVALGLCTPGYVGPDGLLHCAPNNPSIEDETIAADLAKALKLPVVHENDAKCFALAEAHHGAGKGKENVIGVIVGTGVGAGLVLNGHVYRGALGAAGEIGHAPFNDHDYEYYISGPGIVRSYESFGGTYKTTPEKILKYKTDKDLDWEIPDEEESAVMLAQNYTYDALARLTATLIDTFNPNVIVFGGGVANSFDYKRLRKKTEKYALDIPFKAVEIKQFVLTDSAGSIGAAMLALQNRKVK